MVSDVLIRSFLGKEIFIDWKYGLIRPLMKISFKSLKPRCVIHLETE
jgi:hypothetical protein